MNNDTSIQLPSKLYQKQKNIYNEHGQHGIDNCIWLDLLIRSIKTNWSNQIWLDQLDLLKLYSNLDMVDITDTFWFKKPLTCILH